MVTGWLVPMMAGACGAGRSSPLAVVCEALAVVWCEAFCPCWDTAAGPGGAAVDGAAGSCFRCWDTAG